MRRRLRVRDGPQYTLGADAGTPGKSLRSPELRRPGLGHDLFFLVTLQALVQLRALPAAAATCAGHGVRVEVFESLARVVLVRLHRLPFRVADLYHPQGVISSSAERSQRDSNARAARLRVAADCFIAPRALEQIQPP